MKVNNKDVEGIHSRLNRYIEEMLKCVSASGSMVSAFDMARIRTYLSAMRFYHDFVKGLPQQDLPETHPRDYVLRANPEIVVLENESLNDLIGMICLCRDELVQSQTALQASGIYPFDSVRFIASLDRCEMFLTNYVEKATPLDMPESTPRADSVMPGRQNPA